MGGTTTTPGAAQAVPQMPAGAPQGMPPGAPQYGQMPPQGMPQGMPQGGAPQGMPPQGAPQGAPQYGRITPQGSWSGGMPAPGTQFQANPNQAAMLAQRQQQLAAMSGQPGQRPGKSGNVPPMQAGATPGQQQPAGATLANAMRARQMMQR